MMCNCPNFYDYIHIFCTEFVKAMCVCSPQQAIANKIIFNVQLA